MTVPASRESGTLGASFAPPLDATEPYLLLPLPLALDLRHSPLATAIYLLVARIFLVQQEPVALSATDIQAIDASGTLSRGAIIGALNRLLDTGWLLAEGQRGKKAAYLPTWGRVAGDVAPWSISEPALGKPRRMRATRVPRVVLDICVGRVTPHHQHAALVERYVTRPPLMLRDIGAYALAWARVGQPTAALLRLGLAGPSGPLPPPSSEVLLARISQLVFFDPAPEPPTLTSEGMRRVGIVSAPPRPGSEPQPLFFVPPDMIGSMIPPMIIGVIDNMISDGGKRHCDISASPSGKAPSAPAQTAITGNQANFPNQGTSTSPDSSSSSSDQAPITEIPEVPIPDDTAHLITTIIPPAAAAADPSQVEQALRTRGLFPHVARRYADMAPETIERASAIAERLHWAKEPRGVMVWLLDEERSAPGWMLERWGHLLPTSDAAHVQAGLDNDVDDSDARTPIYRQLRDGLDSQLRPCVTIEQLTLADGVVSLAPPRWLSADERDEIYAALDAVATQLGLVVAPATAPATHTPPAPPQPILAERVSPLIPADLPPDWIDPSAWADLRVVERAALLGSRWEDGAIVGTGPQITKLLRTRLASLVERLRPDTEPCCAHTMLGVGCLVDSTQELLNDRTELDEIGAQRAALVGG
ncbi:hypothetical protein K2Z83_11745 [Oscillochloris sp. ZM17-4]|uniref:hypothetical protein n=1 Tax=Oscillochloris sp. ZM17-4 TaxID=2866714 RepID=UPI001C73306F|nr:hypothetical protein [Oscillochloris sp. ZM17-4]MBX0328349.1 hypothetical protein [Oscillochloris sp. ZM17-4]